MDAKSLRVLWITLLSFAIYFVLDDLYFHSLRKWINEYINQIGVSHIITYSVFGIPLLLGSLLIHHFRNLLSSLGLNGSLAKGFLFPLLCTLPMLIGYAIVFEFNPEINLSLILISAVSAAFFEELYFRGFLFGQLYRFTQLGFLPSILLGAIVFALIHLYQSQDPLTLLGIFLTTFLGAILFAWLYAEWNFNIWIPIFLHLFMNLFWMMFSAGENALGGVYSNVFRILTIVLAIVLTILYKRKKGMKLEVTKSTLWMKKREILIERSAG
ncbi:CPBP family intramembrane metalloprotease [Marivirga sp. S37H4]|uniref:CPBP family intramembrane metalloprotease n=1 Tax=Marivirga aurantiaca TaxID=2802615 RepID=A0A934WZI1_9BACT|nr:type II CAAX endopeptidase family protein [Marivirga aurantiaca]MBK6266088.1 CPBP family intramembrane metalloprotease [Marivirga aurantiaca]